MCLCISVSVYHTCMGVFYVDIMCMYPLLDRAVLDSICHFPNRNSYNSSRTEKG